MPNYLFVADHSKSPELAISFSMREMNPTSPLPEGKCKLQAQGKVRLRVTTFYKWKKSMLQLLQNEIHDRSTEVLPSAF